MPVALLGFALASLHPSTFADELFGDFYYTATPTEITITLYGGSAQSVIVPSQITNVPVRTIKATAFAGQSGFTNVIIPDSVTTFQGPTFSSCSSLASISLGGGLSALGDAPFAGCTNLATIAVHATNAAYSSIDGVLFNKSATTLLYYPLGKSGAYTIPDGTLTIAEHAFEVHPKLSSVTMPDSVVNIANSAFNSCTALGSVQVGNGVTNIGDFAFISCTNLSDLTLGSSVKTIGPMAFSGCTRLARVTLPSSLSNGDRLLCFRRMFDPGAHLLSRKCAESGRERLREHFRCGQGVLSARDQRLGPWFCRFEYRALESNDRARSAHSLHYGNSGYSHRR
ncbi:MAG: leucine-rich repeat domain-containing protein [Kiritimatiellae bacterium]|nr:leucine-rich repeat domain-containing protein [Kiritimatiellia bacterium]